MVDYEFYLNYFINEIIPRSTEIITKPIVQKNILWTIGPLILTLFLIQIYFGRYKNEEIGWNTAFSNTISMLWVTTNLFKFIYENSSGNLYELFFENYEKIILVSLLSIWAIISIILQFYHALPKKVDFIVYSSIPVYVTSILLVILIIGDIKLDITTLYSSIFLMLIFVVFFFLLRHNIKAPKSVKISLSLRRKHKKEERKREILKLKRTIRDKENYFKLKITNFFNKLKFWN